MATRWQVYLASLGTPVGSDHDGTEYLETHNLIYDTEVLDSDYTDKDEYIIYNPALTREANQAGSFECDIPPTNSGYDKFDTFMLNVSGLLKTYISIYRDGEPIWQGRITEINIDFDKNKHIYAEGDMALYNDFQVKVNWADYVEYQDEGGIYIYYISQFFRDMAQVPLGLPFDAEGKMISPSDDFPEIALSTVETNLDDVVYMSRWDALTDSLLNGMLKSYENRAFLYITRTRTSGSSIIFKRWLNLLVLNNDGTVMYGNAPLTSQTIEYGKNLLDLSISYNANEIYSVIHAYGYTTKGWWIFKSTNEIDAMNYDSELLAQYGWIEKVISIDGESTTVENLNDLIRNKLYELKNESKVNVEITIKAIDLVYAGENTDHLDFMKRTHIVSEPHGIDDIYLCTKTVEYLDDPSRNEYTFGRNSNSLSSSQAVSGRKTDKTYNISTVTKSYVTDS